MNIVFASEFRKKFRGLPQDIQRRYRKQESLFRKNWRDPRLHTKKLTGNVATFSFRITSGYRALFTFVDFETVLFATIGHRKDIYR